jgi:hypothetical protein
VTGVVVLHPAVEQRLEFLQALRLVISQQPLLQESEEALYLPLGLGIARQMGKELDI